MRTVASNKSAFFNYEIIERLEAGISLFGSEVKSVRDGRVSLKESYAEIRNGEVFLVHANISPYEPANRFNHEPVRDRKLLLHRREIKRLIGKIREKGWTLIPTQVVLTDKGKVKVELALGKGKRAFEKRQSIKDREVAREVRAELKKRLR